MSVFDSVPMSVAECLRALIDSKSRQAAKFLSESLVVKATHRRKPKARDLGTSVVVTFGRPNYRERDFLRMCRKAKEPIPLKRVQLRPWPKKRAG